jgi:hypothetical protein
MSPFTKRWTSKYGTGGIPGLWRVVALALVICWLGIGLHGIAHTLEHDCAELCIICCVVTGILHAVALAAPLLAFWPVRERGLPVLANVCPHRRPAVLGANGVRGPPVCG